jgi:hypothetical protein
MRPSVAFLAFATLLLAGQIALEPSAPEAIRDPCDIATKRCPAQLPESLGLPPLTGWMATESPLAPLRPYLPSNIYDLADGLLPDQEVAPVVPVPSRPTGLGAEAGANATIHVEANGVGIDGTLDVRLRAPIFPDAAVAEEGQVPCEARGCPDLVVDASRLLVGTIEDRTFAVDHCAVDEGSTQPGARRLLRFTFTSVNIGDGDLRIGQAHQHPQWFTWGVCHGHYHFREYADYRLWTPEGYSAWSGLRQEHPDARPQKLLASNPDLLAQFVAGHKQGFCAIDVWPYAPVDPQKYTNCMDVQGVSRGWADEYGFQLDGQWIDITGLEAGLYVLEAEANPEHLYQELDYTNNSGAVYVLVPPI